MKRVYQCIVIILLLSCLMPAFGQTECPEYTFAKIADTDTPVPGGNGGTFSGFGQFVATDSGEVAFSAGGSGFSGLFVSGLCRVIDTNNTLEGKDVTQLFMGRDSYSVGMLGFRAVFSDGSRGIYLAKALGSSPTVAASYRRVVASIERMRIIAAYVLK